MAALSPARKRIAILIVLVGSVLIGERVLSLVAADGDVVAPVARQSASAAEGGARTAVAANDKTELRLRTDRLDARQQALAVKEPSARAPQPKASLFDSVSWRPPDRKSTRLNSSHLDLSRMPSSA